MKDEMGESTLEEVRVFVYGTLKPGEENYDSYCKHCCEAQEAMVLGNLYDLPFGYPALTAESLPVYGFLLSFANPNTLATLDELENYNPARPLDQNEYFRVRTAAFSLDHQPLGWAWIYCMELARVQRMGGVLLPEGKWTSKRK